MKNLSSNDKKCVYGIILSCIIMVFGILFLVNAMGVANFYKSYAAIKNPLAKYLVVILVMATGIISVTGGPMQHFSCNRLVSFPNLLF